MRILHRYIFSNLLSTFVIALLVLSFVMMVGLLFKATGYIASGASLENVLRFLALGFPGTLSLSIPIAALVSTLLVFGRLSSDSEISAMRACGVSMRRIMLTPFLLGIALSLASFYITGVVSPNSSYARRTFRRIVKTSDILAIIEPGKSIVGVPGMPDNSSLFVQSRDGDMLYDVRILEPLPEGGMRDIKAKEVYVVQNTNGTVLLQMHDATISPLRLKGQGELGVGQAEYFEYTVGDELENRDEPPPRRIKDLVSADLEKRIAETYRTIDKTREDIADNLTRISMISNALEEARAAYAVTQALLAAETAALPPEATTPAGAEPPTSIPSASSGDAGVLPRPSQESAPPAPSSSSPGGSGDLPRPLEAPSSPQVEGSGVLPRPSQDAAPKEAKEPHEETLEEQITNLETRIRTLTGRDENLRYRLEDLFEEASKMRTEGVNRIVLALASLCFIAVAVPYGLKSSRRESSIGTAICLGVCVFYNLVLITTESLAKHPAFYPHVIAWIPVVLCVVLSLHGIRKNT